MYISPAASSGTEFSAVALPAPGLFPDAEFLAPEVADLELLWPDILLTKSSHVFQDTWPATTPEIPSQTITVRKAIAIRFISPLLQLLPALRRVCAFFHLSL